MHLRDVRAGRVLALERLGHTQRHVATSEPEERLDPQHGCFLGQQPGREISVVAVEGIERVLRVRSGEQLVGRLEKNDLVMQRWRGLRCHRRCGRRGDMTTPAVSGGAAGVVATATRGASMASGASPHAAPRKSAPTAGFVGWRLRASIAARPRKASGPGPTAPHVSRDDAQRARAPHDHHDPDPSDQQLGGGGTQHAEPLPAGNPCADDRGGPRGPLDGLQRPGAGGPVRRRVLACRLEEQQLQVIGPLAEQRYELGHVDLHGAAPVGGPARGNVRARGAGVRRRCRARCPTRWRPRVRTCPRSEHGESGPKVHGHREQDTIEQLPGSLLVDQLLGGGGIDALGHVVVRDLSPAAARPSRVGGHANRDPEQVRPSPPGSMLPSLRAATRKTCCAASSIVPSATPRRRSERHTTSKYRCTICSRRLSSTAVHTGACGSMAPSDGIDSAFMDGRARASPLGDWPDRARSITARPQLPPASSSSRRWGPCRDTGACSRRSWRGRSRCPALPRPAP